MAVYKDYSSFAESQGSRVTMRVPYFALSCKFCGSSNIIKYGTVRGVQRFLCKDCRRKFADNDALPHMQIPIDQVGAAVGMYYEGQSLNSSRRLLAQIYRSYPSDSTIYRWVTRFTQSAINEAKQYKPNVGDTWVADETVLEIDGKNVWFWDIIDSRTRFLLASHISRTRTTKDAQKLMELASERAGKAPKVVITDKLYAYLDGVELAFGSDTEHVRSKPFTTETNTNLIERFHGSLKDRTKVMRGLKNLRTAKLITDGWLLHYNFFRPHESLGKTPAEAAGVKFPYRNWQDIVAKRRVVTPKQTTTTSAIPIPAIAGYPAYTTNGFKIVGRKPAKTKRRRRELATAGVSRIRR